MGNEVLISSSSCGLIDESSSYFADQNRASTILHPFTSRQLTSQANYVQRCYSNVSGTVGSCGLGPFVKSRLPSKISRNASYPFDSNLCRRKDRNIKLEAAIDSHLDLGLNAPSERRYSIKTINYCAPIVTEGFKKIYNSSYGTSYARCYYGSRRSSNYTYEYEQRSWEKWLSTNLTSAFEDYKIS